MKLTTKQLATLSGSQLVELVDLATQERIAKHRTTHGLHILLSLLTCGVWILFWALVAWSNARERAATERNGAAFKKQLLLGIADPKRLLNFLQKGYPGNFLRDNA